MIEINHRHTGATICAFYVLTVKAAAEVGRANLRGADLSGANLIGADLPEANLRWADLRWADLSEADLRWADLRWADLRWADLRKANLRGADLSGADMRKANLDGEILSRTPLTITNLRYWCLITDGFMRLGCKRYSHAEWAAFTDDQISKMDSGALEFWRHWKEPLLAMCAAHAGGETK